MELSDKVLAKTSENWVYATRAYSVLNESLQQRQIEARIAATRGTTQVNNSLFARWTPVAVKSIVKV